VANAIDRPHNLIGRAFGCLWQAARSARSTGRLHELRQPGAERGGRAGAKQRSAIGEAADRRLSEG